MHADLVTSDLKTGLQVTRDMYNLQISFGFSKTVLRSGTGQTDGWTTDGGSNP